MGENFFSIQATMVLHGKYYNGTAVFATNRVTFLNGSTTLFYKQVNWQDIKIDLTEERIHTFLFFSKKKISLVLRENQNELPTIIFSKELKNELVNKLNQICREAREEYADKARKQKLEEERLRKLEEERQQKQEEERLRKIEEERQQKLEVERIRKLEEERRQKLEKERLRKLEEERQQKLEEERLRKLEKELRQRLEEELLRKLEEVRQQKLEEQRLRKLEEERQQKLEEERLRKLEEERRHRLEEELLRKLKEVRQQKLEEERLRKLEEERQQKLEEERLRKIEEERRHRLEEKLLRKLEEVRQQKLEEERLRKLEEVRQQKLEEERQQKLEAERLRKIEEVHQQMLEAERLRKLEEERQQKLEEERLQKLEEERQQKLEEERLRKIEKVRRQVLEVERLQKLEEERQQKFEEERLRKLEEERKQRQEEERLRKLEEERQQRQEEKCLRKLKEDRQQKLEEERLRKLEKERQQRLEKGRNRLIEQEDQYYIYSIEDTLEYPECNEFQYFANRFVFDCRDARVEILAEYLLTFLKDYYDTRNGKNSKINLVDKCSELILTLNQMEAGYGYESLIEGAVTDAIGADYYDPTALRQLLEEIIIDYHYKLRLNSGIYLQAYSDSYGLKHVRESNAYYIEKGDIYVSTIFDDGFEGKELKDLYSHRASIREDQIERIRNYIENQKKPVNKDFLKTRFAGCSSATISTALNHINILHYGKRVLSAKNLIISTSEKNALEASIKKVVIKKNSIIHIKVLYDRIYMEYYDLFMRLFIDNESHLFNVIHFLYNKEFSFKNPYLAQRGTVIPSPEDRLRQYAFKKGELDLDDYLYYAHDNYIKITGILNSINLLNSRMLLKNRDQLISIDKTGISMVVAKTIESLIFEEIDDEEVVALRDLNCISKFPAIRIPWDEWFIYSVLNKWGNKLFLYTTAPQFRSSIPVVSKNSFVTAEDLQIIANKHAGDINRVLNSSIDDLDNLDELIEESIDLEDIDDLDDFEFSLTDYDKELYQ